MLFTVVIFDPFYIFVVRIVMLTSGR